MDGRQAAARSRRAPNHLTGRGAWPRFFGRVVHTYALMKDREVKMQDPKMLEKVATAPGFIAALDQSGGSTPKALKGYGIQEDAYSNDEEMFALIHDMRSRIITSPSFSGEIGRAHV